MEKIYDVVGHGNFSISFGWDDGLPNLSASEYEPDDYTPPFKETCRFMGREVYEYFTNEHGGSRTVYMLVKASSDGEALKKAKLYAEFYYPER